MSHKLCVIVGYDLQWCVKPTYDIPEHELLDICLSDTIYNFFFFSFHEVIDHYE